MLCAFVSATLAISMEPSSDTLASRSTSLDRNDSDLIFANARTQRHQYRGAPKSNNNAITGVVVKASMDPSAGCIYVVVGSRVARGRDWMWSEQDGSPGNLGTVTADLRSSDSDGWVKVLWDSIATSNNYRITGGYCDLRLPDTRLNTITRGNVVYSTVTDVPISGTSVYAHIYFLPIPSGWAIAPDTAETRNVIMQYGWSTHIAVMASGVGIRTTNFAPAGLVFGDSQPKYITNSQGWVNCPWQSYQIVIVKQIKVCDLVGEVNPTPLNAFISCGESIIDNIVFASYGTPTGSCETGFAIGTCNSASSLDIVKQMCVGKNSCTVSASNSVFGDPCYGTLKRLGILATCSTKVTNVMFAVAAADRVAGKAAVQATFSFTPSAGGAGPSSVTLNYPPGFFSPSATPTTTLSTAGATLTPGAPGVTSIILAATGSLMAALTAVTVTLVGCTMGVAMAAADSVTVRTDTDPIASSPALSSGAIGGAVTNVFFSIPGSDRVAGKTSAAATFSFTTTAGGALAAGSTITLTYPSGFVAASALTGAQISGGVLTGSVAAPTSTRIVITTATQAILASTAVTITVTGLTVGVATGGSSNGITVATSADQTASIGVSSGVIGGQVTSVSFTMATSDRVAGKTSAAATFSFTTTSGGALAAGSTITLTYPSGFVAASALTGAQISGGVLTGSVAAPTSTRIVITTATQAILASTAVTITVTGLTVGVATGGSSNGITVATSADQTASIGVSSGVIGGQVTSVSFTMATSDRVAGKTSAAATFSFTTTSVGALAVGSTITLTYPSGFVAASALTGAQISGGVLTGSVAAPTSTRIVITTATQAILASTAVTITVTGLTVGVATGGSSNGITVATSADQTASIGVSSGVIGGQVTSVSFTMATSDRVAGKTSAAATFSFTTTSGGALAAGSTITLTYPSGFVAASALTGAQISGGVLTGSVAAPTSTRIVITTATQAILASTAVTITVTGLTVGVATGGSSNGITVATSADQTASIGVSSGVIGGQVTSVSFTMATSDRVAGQTSAAATFSFTTTAGGALAAGSTITLTYPSGFVAASALTGAQISGGVLTGSVAAPTSTRIVITTATQAILASTAVTITVTGLTVGVATGGSSNGITVATSADQTASIGVSSGVIGGQVTSVSFTMATSDHVAGQTSAAATFSFTTTAGGALAAGSTITLTYPSGFVAASALIGAQISGGVLTGSVAAPTSTRIVITTATQAILASTAVTITVTGLTVGVATGGSSNGITVATSADQTASIGVSSGVIGGQVTSVSFTMATSDRVAGQTSAAATFSFTTTAGGALAAGSTITLTYPSGFVAASALTGAQISGGVLTGSVAAPTSTRIVITTATQAILASTAVTITVTGLTVGVATGGSSNGITVATSADQTASIGVSSGVIGGQVTSVSFTMATSDRVAGQTSAAATFSFTTTAGGALAAGSTITLTYPSGFVAASALTGAQISGGVLTGSVAAPTSTRIVITTATQAILASTAVTITVTGLTVGVATGGSSNGITVATSADQTASIGVSSGVIGGQVTSVSFTMATSDRVAGKTSAAATFSFTTTSGGALAAGSTITLTYPYGFFRNNVVSGAFVNGFLSSCESAVSFTSFRIFVAGPGVVSSATVTVTVFGLSLSSSSSDGFDYGNVAVSTGADPVYSQVSAGPIYGVLSSPLVMLSQYLRNSPTTIIFEFMGFSTAFIKSVAVQAVHGFSASSLVPNCTLNKITSVGIFSCAYSGSTLTLVLNVATRLDQTASIRCTVTGLNTPTVATVARNDMSISTFHSSGGKVDVVFSVVFPPIFNNVALGPMGYAPLTLSSLVRSTLIPTFIVSFTSSGAAPISFLTIQGLFDFSTSKTIFSSDQMCSHNNIAANASTTYSSPFLKVLINGSGFASSSSAIVCTIKGLILPTYVADARSDLVISSFEANGAPVDTLAGVSLPAIFAGEASAVKVSLSSVIRGSSNVTMTLSFISPNPSQSSYLKGSIRTISVTGLFFSSYVPSDEVRCVQHSEMALGSAAFFYSTTDPFLVIRLSGNVALSSGPFPISCTIKGFTNSASQRIASFSVGFSSWDLKTLPIDIASNILFPNIFAYSATNVSVGLSSQVVSKTRVTMTVNFNAPYAGQPATFITISGLSFASSSQQFPLEAVCYVDSSVNRISDSVTFDSVASELTMSFIFAPTGGLPLGSSGSLLAVTCSIKNLINAPAAISARSAVSIAVFGANFSPLYIQSAVKFPAIHEESLGLKRPRVSCCPLKRLYLSRMFNLFFSVADHVIPISCIGLKRNDDHCPAACRPCAFRCQACLNSGGQTLAWSTINSFDVCDLPIARSDQHYIVFPRQTLHFFRN
jgi:hypothetical protein